MSRKLSVKQTVMAKTEDNKSKISHDLEFELDLDELRKSRELMAMRILNNIQA